MFPLPFDSDDLSRLLSAARLEKGKGHQAAAIEINRRMSCLEVPPAILDELGHNVSSRIRGWCSYASRFGEAQYDKAISKLGRIIQARAKQVGVMESASYKQWVTTALEKGAGPAHAWTRQTERAPPLPESAPLISGK